MANSSQNKLRAHIEQIRLKTNTVAYEIFEGTIDFTLSDASDSVKLVWDYIPNFYCIEVFPIDQNKTIEIFHFGHDKEHAIRAFNMWATYYRSVVQENFKMF